MTRQIGHGRQRRRRVLREREAGVRVRAATASRCSTRSPGTRALGLATAKQPAAVVVDGDMVGVDGYELTQQLKAMPELAVVPGRHPRGRPNEAIGAQGASGRRGRAHAASRSTPAALVEKVIALLAEAPAHRAGVRLPPVAGADAAASEYGACRDAGRRTGGGVRRCRSRSPRPPRRTAHRSRRRPHRPSPTGEPGTPGAATGLRRPGRGSAPQTATPVPGAAAARAAASRRRETSRTSTTCCG